MAKRSRSRRVYKNVQEYNETVSFSDDEDYDDESSDSSNEDYDYENFEGPVEKRSMTDPLFSFLLFLTWIVGGYIGYWALQHGDPITLVHPSDYKGRNCGLDTDDNGVILPPYYHPVDIIGNGICIDECPQENLFNPVDRSQLFCKDDKDLLGMIGCSLEGKVTDNIDLLIICGGCMYQSNSFEAMDFCIPNSIVDLLNQVDVSANATGFDPLQQLHIPSLVPYIERFIRDVWISKEAVFGFGLGGSVILGFSFLVLLRIPCLVSILVWAAACLTPIAIGFGGYYCHMISTEYKENPDTFQKGEHFIRLVQYSAYILYALAAIIICALAFLRKRIMLAISITKAAAKAVVAFPFTVFYPFIQLFGYVALVVPWCVFMIYLAGTGTKVQKSQEIFSHEVTYTSYEYTENVQYSFWFMIFIFFWTSEFIVALGQITLAMCYSKWYFTADKNSGVKSSVLKCLCTSFLYHMGTAAFGSLVLAIIRFIRTFLLWVQKKVKESGLDNKSADILFCCCQCCLKCLEKCLKFLSKNAYVQTALFSYSFCKASRKSFLLILRNVARVFAVGIVSELSMIYCKMFIVCGVSVASYFYMTEHHDAELYSALSVVSVVAFLSWFVANMFLEVLGIAITTILQCFLADEEMNPNGCSPFVPKELDAFLEQLEDDREHDLDKK